jgi:tetratricopeptide (TPR) repeat protein
LLERLPGALSIAWFYFKQLFAPDTTFHHTPLGVPGWGDATTIGGLLVLLGGAALLAYTIRRKHWLTAVLVLAAGQYLIVGNLLTPVGVYAANRLTLPFTLAGAAVLAHWLAGLTKGSTRKRAVAVIPVSAVVLLMAWTVFAQVNPRWFSVQRLMAAEYAHKPAHPAAGYLYGTALVEANPPRAVELLAEASRGAPGSIQAHWQLAHVYELTDDVPAAAAQLERIIELKPDHLQALNALALLEIYQGNLPRARLLLHRARKVDAYDPAVMRNWAYLAVAGGQADEAVRRYQALLEAHPNHRQGKRELQWLSAQVMDWVVSRNRVIRERAIPRLGE